MKDSKFTCMGIPVPSNGIRTESVRKRQPLESIQWLPWIFPYVNRSVDRIRSAKSFQERSLHLKKEIRDRSSKSKKLLAVKLKLTQEHNDVCFNDQLSLWWAMNVGNATVLRFMQQWWSANVIPHLSGNHGEAEWQSQNAPHTFVEQKVQIVSSQIQETANQWAQHKYGDGTRIVWWTENADLSICTFVNPFGDRFSHVADSLNV